MVLSVPAGVLRVCTLRRFLPTLRITCCISLHDALFLENLVCNNVTAVAEMAVQVKSNLRLVIFFVMRFRNNTFFFYKVVLSVPHLTPNLDSQCIPFFVWVNNFDLSGMWDPTSSYSTASVILSLFWPLKLQHYVKIGIHSSLPNLGVKTLQPLW